MAKREYVNPRELLGGTIQSIIPVSDAHGGPGACVMIVTVPVRKRGGKMIEKTFHCETWRDPEGNGPGFLYVEDLDLDATRTCPDCELELSKDGKKLANGGRHSKDEFNNCVTPD